MELNDRIATLATLGEFITTLPEEDLAYLAQNAYNENNWFVKKSIDLALSGIGKILNEESLRSFCDQYEFKNEGAAVGIVMAGNIPAVGFHDLLCALLCGCSVQVKLSSSDTILPKAILQWIRQIEPQLGSRVEVVDKLNLKRMHKVIATGSNNTSRYFEAYFKSIPRLIRQSRSSCAVLYGNEAKNDFAHLGQDIFQYFGLGCRNVTKLYVPENYDFKPLLDVITEEFKFVLDNTKYANNYGYQRSIFLINGAYHLDTGFLLLTEKKEIASALSTLHYEYYQNEAALDLTLTQNTDEIQCIVSKEGKYAGSVDLGCAQQPEIDDYADGIDTMEFLLA